MPAYRIDKLTKRFGHQTALAGISFEAHQGEFLVILGATGAGKTTLLRTIAGLEQPSGGEIFEDSTPITRATPAQRDMAMVFQNFSLYPRLTVFDNLAFGLRPAWRGIARDEIEKRVRWAAELLGLTDKLTSRPTELSGGQQQRVAIGRAIVREPKLFLFDEPLASLDAKLRESMTLELHRLQRRLNVTMLYVTHDQIEAMALADRIAVLDAGKILQVGTPDEIYRRPISPRVAQMLGSPPINLLSTAEASALFPQLAIPSGTTAVGIRPEHLQIVPHPEGIATVRVVEHLGPMTVVHLSARTIKDTAELRISLPSNAPIAMRERISLLLPQNLLYFQ
ncbi:MAG TPA: ABC transporter ATP-binding protein [Phycisphaerae bacterium]|jgi:ABC-type sugar transport system ATPase subunit